MTVWSMTITTTILYNHYSNYSCYLSSLFFSSSPSSNDKNISQECCQNTAEQDVQKKIFFLIAWILRQEGMGQGTMIQQMKQSLNRTGFHKNWLAPTGLRMVEDLTPGRPWASLCLHCDTLTSKPHSCKVPWQFWGQPLKAQNWVMPQFLEIPAPYPTQNLPPTH